MTGGGGGCWRSRFFKIPNWGSGRGIRVYEPAARRYRFLNGAFDLEVSENRGPKFSQLNSRVLTIRTPK